MKRTGRSTVVIVVLVLAAVVVSVALFRFLAVGGLVLLSLALLGLLVWLSAGLAMAETRAALDTALPDGRRGPGGGLPAAGGRTGSRALEHARRTGASNMRTAWISWHLRSLPQQEDNVDPGLLTGTLAVVPQADWDEARLRQHGRALWSLRTSARLHHLLEHLDARLDRTVAMISDLTDGEFDTSLGQVNDQYLYHPDRELRTAYLEGGALGVEAIVDAVTAARAQAREDAATKAAAQSLAQQRNAVLKALRETHRPTEIRDAHAAWEEQVKKIEE